MKRFTRILVIALALFISQSAFSQIGWSSLSTSYVGNFKAIYFNNVDTGYAVGGNNSTGIVYKTTDGGLTWASSSISGSSLESVWFTSATVGYVAGSNGKIYKTTNAGGAWVSLTTYNTTDISDIHFPTANDGFAVSDTALFVTVTAGSGWAIYSVPTIGTTSQANGVFFTTASSGVIYGSTNFFNGWIRRTTNGGSSWSSAFTTAATINDVFFVSATEGYAVGNAGGIYKTTNSGSSWLMKASGITTNLNSVFFVNSNIGYAVGENGVIIKTLDGGTTWNSQNTGVSNLLRGVFSASTNVTYVVGDNNKIMKTTTGGVTLLVNTPDDSAYCNGYVNLHAYTTYDGTGTLSYTWDSSPLLSSTTDSVVTAGPFTNDEYFIVTVSDGTISYKDTAFVQVVGLPSDSICIVAVDSLSGHPIVVFEKQVSGPIDYYNIYRESVVAGIFDSIGFVPADSAGVFIDSNSNVLVQQYAYRISSVDSCGNESAYSDVHKTMHLQVSAGAGGAWNLLWSPYEGVFVQSYEVWRGADTINMLKIGTVPGSNNSYSDLSPPSGTLYYYVKIISAYTCHPYNYKANTDYNSSRSNNEGNGIIVPSLATGFSATPLSGGFPLNVQFTDATAGIPSSWMWYFGDGATSTQQSPAHTYTTAGSYTVKLVTSTSTAQDSIEKIDYITVTSGLNADFSATPTHGNAPLVVQFTDASSGSPSDWLWDFGDGNSSVQQSPSHSYNADGLYTVKLTVTENGVSESMERIDYINVGGIGFDDIDLDQHLRIYPNPTHVNTKLNIDFEQIRIKQVQLLNLIGKEIPVEYTQNSGHIELDLNNVSQGIYFLKLTSSTGDNLVRKIIVR
ncbi:MAG: PKD domain-containing protein [Bacteroidales bacterium]|nr:PKD domain-containing protein [Bacteroidales bacterium]